MEKKQWEIDYKDKEIGSENLKITLQMRREVWPSVRMEDVVQKDYAKDIENNHE